MIRGRLWEMVDERGMQQLDEAALRLLHKAGARIEHEHVLNLLEQAGCRVDRAALRCWFSEKLVRNALAHFKQKIPETFAASDPWTPHVPWLGGSYPHFLEWPACQRRLATREDVIHVARMGHMLPEFKGVGQVLTCTEIDPRVEPIWNVVARMEITDKPIGGGEVLYWQHIRHLAALGELLGGPAGRLALMAHCNFSVAPMIFSRRALECIIEKARVGCRHEPGTMPISGISGPVTIAGTVAICLAELMAGWVIGYLLDPKLPATGIVASGSLDMRTLNACFGSPEAWLQDLLTVQVCRQLYGIQIHPALGYVDCKTPGIRAAFEKMMAVWAWPFVGGQHLVQAHGLLSAGQDYSPVQHLLEIDLYSAFDRFAAPVTIDQETLALDLIESFTRAGGTLLDAEHTAAHHARELWRPRWIDRRTWQGDVIEGRAELEMLERIDRYWKDAVARYQPPAMDSAKLAEARKILKSAEAEMEKLDPQPTGPRKH